MSQSTPEPFSALDVLRTENLRGELMELWPSRRMPTQSIFLVTHNIEEAVLLADRIIVFGRNPGRVRADFEVLLRQPRDRHSHEFLLYVDYIYKLMTQPLADAGPLVAGVLQPTAQVATSIPATALFPIVVLFLIRVGGGLGRGSIVLLLLGTQWYILFNVITGESAIPTDLREVCEACGLGTAQRWRQLLLPAVFPFIITGFVTASGGARNASIVAD